MVPTNLLDNSVVVIGAGPVDLAAASPLIEKGAVPLVLEWFENRRERGSMGPCEGFLALEI